MQYTEQTEPFSLAAFAKSGGTTTKKSEVTPRLPSGTSVRLKKLYPHILERLPWKKKYKRYFSTWTIYAASWSIEFECWNYHIRQGPVFIDVSLDMIEKTPDQKQLSGEPIDRYLFRQRNVHKKEVKWAHGQQPLLGEDRWRAGDCDLSLRRRLHKLKS